jgi:hypothetical protein
MITAALIDKDLGSGGAAASEPVCGGIVLRARSKLRRKPGPWRKRAWARWNFTLPRKAQLALLDLPALRLHQAACEKVILVRLLGRLIERGIGFNEGSRLLEIAPSTMHAWRSAYVKWGVEGFIKRSAADRSRHHEPRESACRLLVLTPI